MEQWALRTNGTAFVITGPTGIGKTLLLKVFALRIDGRLRSAYVPYPALSVPELCHWVLRELGESPGDDPESALARVATNLRSRGSTLLLLIDDAMRMPIATVNALSELGRSSGHAVGLVLTLFGGAGAERVLSALGGEATVVSFDTPMSPSETAEFVQAELERAGVSPEARARFGAAEIEALHERSAGVPARLNTEARRVLDAIEGGGQLSVDMPASEAGTSRPDPEAGPAGPAAPAGDHATPSPAPPVRATPPARGPRKRLLGIPPALGWTCFGFLAGVAFTLGLDAFRGALVEMPLFEMPPFEAPTLAAATPAPRVDAADATAEALPVVTQEAAPVPMPPFEAPTLAAAPPAPRVDAADATAEAPPVVTTEAAPVPMPPGEAPTLAAATPAPRVDAADAAAEAPPVATTEAAPDPVPKANAAFVALANEGSAPPAAEETAGATHTVQPGQSLWEIGRLYGVGVEDIVRMNQISDARTLPAGSRIAIPSTTPPGSAASAAPIEGEPGTPPDTGESVAVLLVRASDQLNAAQFQAALDTTEAALARFDSRPPTPEAEAQRARLEVVAASAHLAFGREDAARASLERALWAEPDLELDPAASSPNLLRIFRELGADDSPWLLAPTGDSP